jgi:origin recognition complex subunit 1
MVRPKASSLLGVLRDDSDDELGVEDLPWEWICQPTGKAAALLDRPESSRKRKREVSMIRKVGARMGNFECYIGDCVLLKAEGSNEAWVGIIRGFVEEDEDGDRAADFLWFSTEKEIRNNERKRKDHILVCYPRGFLMHLAGFVLTCLVTERALRHAVLGHQPPCVDKRQGLHHVEGEI